MRNTALLACVLLVGMTVPALGQVPGKDQLNVAHPLPPQAPPWLDGYTVRWPVRVVGEPAKQPSQSVVVSLPTGGWLKPDASDLAVRLGTGKLTPLAVLSHDPTGETVIQFKRNGNDAWYWVYGVSSGKAVPGPRADAKTDPAFREGISLEVREWAGADMSSWIAVRAGLEKSPTVIGNAIVTEVTQSSNPARPVQPTKFAASYRGFFSIRTDKDKKDKEGAYRFVVNAEDASFLFIDGFKVCDRPGTNKTLGTIKVKELDKLAGKVDLKAGVHSFEVHQAVGDRPDSAGICALLWSPPGEAKFTYLPPSAVAHPLYARVAALEKADGEAAGLFIHGLDDTVETPGLRLFLVRFEAQGPAKDPQQFIWDFGDGTVGKGRSVTHVYFKEADYQVALTAPSGLPPFRQRVNVWAEPNDTSPLSLETAIGAIAAMEWQKLEPGRIREIFTFLMSCGQPDRWPLLDQVALHLLTLKELDLETKTQVYVARVEALTQMGRAAEALKLVEQVRPELSKTPALQVRLQLAAAAVYQYHFRDPAAASKLYKAILDDNVRTEHPNVRLAAVRWGDLFAETGDLVRASDTYRLAATLGGDKFSGGSTDASTRGALLRIAEQKLKAGDISATRQLLDRLELEHPGRRLDGLYCFLHAESDRFGGRYEEALRHYEMIFKLPQWAGYRDRASWGIAETYFRMGELEKSLKWLADLKDGSPKFWETQKGSDFEKVVGERQVRVKAAQAKGTADSALFKEFVTGFEPDEPEWFGDLKDAASVRAPGMQGPHVLLIDNYTDERPYFSYQRPLKNLIPGATYWVEIWYRDLMRVAPPAPSAQGFVQLNLVDTAPPKGSVTGQPAVLRNSYQRWHKAGGKLKVPLGQDFDLGINFYYLKGVYLFDRLSVRPVTDRQLDALTTYQEGLKTP